SAVTYVAICVVSAIVVEKHIKSIQWQLPGGTTIDYPAVTDVEICVVSTIVVEKHVQRHFCICIPAHTLKYHSTAATILARLNRLLNRLTVR
ncbi:hypothetical protein, partial [Pseudomonas syringae group genomosp. 3]|uniref:hypothetical protein n=1 Tax=Pseudomonas syringae group genomosp. 3 TaxID=251701 RepID=UPI001C820876